MRDFWVLFICIWGAIAFGSWIGLEIVGFLQWMTY
jgi:hypothetical protein